MNWRTGSLERLSKLTSMKLYRVDTEEISSMKYTYYNIQEDGIYLIDNGRHLSIYVGEDVSIATAEDYVDNVDISTPPEITGSKLKQFVDTLHQNNKSYYQGLRCIDKKNRHLLTNGFYVEEAFKKFLKTVND